jgi:hypothetical protein
MYSYSTGEYSSRGIERHCRQDIAYRVITANRVPDHATVARFVVRHQQPLAGLFTQVLELCGKAALVRSGVVAVDGTKLKANASRFVNVDYGEVAREIIETAIRTDETEDEEGGDSRGDELPPELSTDEGRRAWLARELAVERASESGTDRESGPESEHEFDAEKIVARLQGRNGWLLEAKRQLDRDRWLAPGPIPRSRSGRLLDAGQRLDEDLEAKLRGNTAYEHYRATAADKLGTVEPVLPEPLSAAGDTGREGQSDGPGHASDDGESGRRGRVRWPRRGRLKWLHLASWFVLVDVA